MGEGLDIDGRLLCACYVAKDVHGAELVVEPTDEYYKGAGFLDRPVPIAAGEDDIDACVVGTTTDGVVVAFRGTLPPSLHWSAVADWLLDLHADPIAVEGLPGKVHHGFHSAVAAMWDRLHAEVVRQMEASGKGLIITGHSKGGAMASVAAMMFHASGINAEQIVTIASPNPGNVDFAIGFNEIFTGTRRQRRYFYSGDVVPFVPPTRLAALSLVHLPVLGVFFRFFVRDRYLPIGEGHFIAQDSRIYREDAPGGRYGLAVAKDLDLLRRNFRKGKFAEIVAAHGIACGHGYMRGLCGDLVCGPAAPEAGAAVLERFERSTQPP